MEITRRAGLIQSELAMLSVRIDDQIGVAILEPNGQLSESDFESVAKVVDPWIEKYGKLKGLIIRTKSFPGWDSFGALSSHLGFVKDHHKKINRVALVTDSLLGNVAEMLASHFVSAEIRHFPYESLREAKTWTSEDGAGSSA
ncbi:MAG: STAS/SEC14 domain-containing protein [Rubricoccaceae bacterium]|nr:STAS/SEC14 domain-containing protein [Rubricoccaceae bacterium]